MTDTKIAQAREMRAAGMTYRAIGAVFGVRHQAISCALNPELRERNRLATAEWHKKHRKEGRRSALEWYRTHTVEKAAYREEHREERRAYNAKWCKDHLPEHAACEAVRRALILGVTVGNLVEIKEIYRKAKEDPKVRCYLCGKLIPIGYRHVDHIIPLSKGGAHRPSNLAVACDACNQSKGAKLPNEVGILV